MITEEVKVTRVGTSWYVRLPANIVRILKVKYGESFDPKKVVFEMTYDEDLNISMRLKRIISE